MAACPSDYACENWPAQVDVRPFDALLFDLDGTLVETMSLHGRAYIMVFGMLGYHLRTEDYLAHVGPPARIAIAAFAAAAGMSEIDDSTIRTIHAEKKKRFAQILAEAAPQELNAAQLLTRNEHRKPVGVVSSGNREGVDAILRRMGWLHLLDVVISGDDTDQGKPEPAPYLSAAAALGVPPERCLAFEDTAVGVQAATAAGMSVIDVTRPGEMRCAAAVGEHRLGG